jgi:hypothetical protein
VNIPWSTQAFATAIRAITLALVVTLLG